MDYVWLSLLIPPPVYIFLAWTLVAPLWGSILVTVLALLEIAGGIVLLIQDLKRVKRAKEKHAEELDEKLRS